MSRNIPDFGRSYVPVTQGQSLQSTMPGAPTVAAQEGSPVSDGIMNAIKVGAFKDGKSEMSPWQETKAQLNNMAGSARGIFDFAKGNGVEDVGKDLNVSGHGEDAFNMLDAADAASDAGGSSTLASLGSLFGFSNGGTVGSNLLKKYKGHKAHALIAHHWGEFNTDKWLSGPQNHDDVPKHVQYAVDNDLLKSHYASGGIVGYARGGMSPPALPYTLVDDNEPFGASRGDIMPKNNDVMDSLASLEMGNNFGQNNPLPNLAAFGSPATPEPMGMSNIGANEVPDNFDPHNLPPFPLNMPQGGMTQESTLPDVPAVPSEQAGMASASSPSQGIAQATSLDELKDQLKANEPVLDKWQAIAMAGAGMMAGKNRSALTNIGEGVQAGLSDYAQQKANIRDYGLKEAEVKNRAQQLAVEADRWNKEMKMKQEALDQGKFTPVLDSSGHVIGSFDVKHRTFTDAEGNPMTKEQINSSVGSKVSSSVRSLPSDLFKDPTVANDENITGKDLLSQIKDPSKKAMAESILDGKADLKDFSMKSSERADMAGLLHRIDKNYDEHNYGNVTAALKAYNANGNIGKVNNSYSTVIQHVGEAIPQAEALDNESVWTPANSIGNYLITNKGDSRVKVLNSTLTNVATEMAKALNPTGVATIPAIEEQRQNIIAQIDSAHQITDVLKNLANLGRDKINVNQRQYLSDAGDSDFRRQKADSFITQEARDVLNKYNIPVKNMYGDNNIVNEQQAHPDILNQYPNAKVAPNGKTYIPDPKRPGKYLEVQ